MSEIAANSRIATVDEIDYFRLPPTQAIVDKVRFVDCYTTSSNVNASPLEFTIPESGQNFIDLKRSRLEIKFKIKN